MKQSITKSHCYINSFCKLNWILNPVRGVLLSSSPFSPWGSIVDLWPARVNLGRGPRSSDSGHQILSPTLHRGAAGERRFCLRRQTVVVYLSDHCGNSNWALPRAGQDGLNLWETEDRWEQKDKQTRKLGHQARLTTAEHHSPAEGPWHLRSPQSFGARKDPKCIRDTETSIAPDPMPSCPIRVQEKPGSKQKEQPILNTEVGLGQGKG